MAEITKVQKLLDAAQSDALLAKEEELVKSFDILLEQEEMLWFQKSREKLIVVGDRNTTFFHTSTMIRRRRNKIEMLKDSYDMWLSSKKELEKLALDYYKRLYLLDDVNEEKAVGDSVTRFVLIFFF